jgi:hypothetical protein
VKPPPEMARASSRPRGEARRVAAGELDGRQDSTAAHTAQPSALDLRQSLHPQPDPDRPLANVSTRSLLALYDCRREPDNVPMWGAHYVARELAIRFAMGEGGGE